MRVAVFRAAEDGRRTAARLEEIGHEAVLAPVLRIIPTGATVRAGDADGLVLTSAHAAEALSSHPDGITSIRDLPCWCVGARTAEAARAAGFTRIGTGPGTAVGLAAFIVAGRAVSRLTLVAGRDRKPDLERELAGAGLKLDVVEAYDAQAVPRWTADTVGNLSDVMAALHYSSRSATLAGQLAEAAGLRDRFRAWAHYCLSADIATALTEHGPLTVSVSDRPDEARLLALLPTLPSR